MKTPSRRKPGGRLSFFKIFLDESFDDLRLRHAFRSALFLESCDEFFRKLNADARIHLGIVACFHLPRGCRFSFRFLILHGAASECQK